MRYARRRMAWAALVWAAACHACAAPIEPELLCNIMAAWEALGYLEPEPGFSGDLEGDTADRRC